MTNRVELKNVSKTFGEVQALKDVDFILAFYVVHEIPDQQNPFNELETILKLKGELFIVEPPFHVSKKAFAETIKKATTAGFAEVKRPKVLFNKAVVLKK